MLFNFLIVMNFLNLTELVEAVEVHEKFDHEIKGKRIRKELANLQEYQNDNITFKRFFISLAGLSFFVLIPSFRSKPTSTTACLISRSSSTSTTPSIVPKCSISTKPTFMPTARTC